MGAVLPETSEIDRRIGARIRSLREEAGLTLTDYADRIGISRTQVWKYESGVNRVAVSTLPRLARGLEVPVARLTDGIL